MDIHIGNAAEARLPQTHQSMVNHIHEEHLVPDEDVVQQVVQGDLNAFEVLLNRYQHYVSKIVTKHVPYAHTEEVVHDVFIRAYTSLPTFKHTSSFKSWLSSVAVRTCYDFWRKRYRSREIPTSSLSQEQQQWLEAAVVSRSGLSFQEERDLQYIREILAWALNSLSAEDRMVVELVYLEERSGKEAAKLLGWSVANVKVRAFRARKKLQKLLAGVIEI
jgi:RNA polymerase sigma-70 factor (ECF subfamily)